MTTAAIYGRLFFDTNGDNGELSAGGGFEAGVAGVTVLLLDGSGNVLRSTVTDSAGNYAFTGLSAGTYMVQAPTSVSGQGLVAQDIGNDGIDSDGNVVTGQSQVFSLTSTQTVTELDFGYGTSANGLVDGEAAGEFMGVGYTDSAGAIDGGGDQITNTADLIAGNFGNDTILSGDGADSVFGGAGDDVLVGEAGNDQLFGNLGNDTLYGGLGDDQLLGAAGSDVLDGGAGNDLIFGGSDVAPPPAPFTVFVNDSTNDLFRLTIGSDGIATKTFIGTMSQGFLDIAQAADGRLFGVAGGELYRIDTTTAQTTLIGRIGDGTFSSALSFGADGMLYSSSNSNILRFSPETPNVTTVFWTNPAGGRAAGDFLTVGDRMFVSWLTPDGTTTQLLRLQLDQSGNVTGATTLGTLPQESYGLALGPNGEIYSATGNSLLLLNVPTDPINGGTGAIGFSVVSGASNPVGDGYFGATSNVEATLGDGVDTADTLRGGVGNDTIQGQEGNDLLIGDSGNDSLIGGVGDDTLLGDSDGAPSTAVTGAFRWSALPDPTDGGQIDPGDVLSGRTLTQVVNGTVVTVTLPTSLLSDFSNADIVTGGLPAGTNDFSSLRSVAENAQAGTQTIQFSDPVSNVSFSLSELGTGLDYLDILAFDAAGNRIFLDIVQGSDLLVEQSAGIDMRVRELVQQTDGTNDPTAAAIVNIPGPVSRITIAHVSMAGELSWVYISDVTFTTSGLVGPGTGDDLLDGGSGNDVIDAGAGNDTAFGGDGDDLLRGRDGNDVLDGNSGNDSLLGEAGDDNLRGGEGADSLDGGAGNDVLTADAGADTLAGGTGNDVFLVTTPANGAGDQVFGGAEGTLDNDVLDLRGAGLVTLVQEADPDDAGATRGTVTFTDGTTLAFTGIETILRDNDGIVDGTDAGQFMGVGFTDAQGDQITNGADGIRGNGGVDNIAAGGGNDTIFGGDGNDFLNGQLGDDSIVGDAGDDFLLGEAGNDVLSGGEGADLLSGGSGIDTIFGGNGDDAFFTGGGDQAFGGDGDDLFYLDATDPATDINAVIDGGRDATDGFAAGPEIGDAGDVLDLSEGTTGQVVTYGSTPDNGTVNGLDGDAGADLTFAEIERVVTGGAGDTVLAAGVIGAIDIATGAGNDTITAGDGNDRIDAGADNDVVNANAGNDSVTAGAGDDTVDAGAGDDTVDAGTGNDVVLGQAGADLLLGGDGNDSLDGGADNDTLDGGTGDDTLQGGDGRDRLAGGAGADLLAGGGGADLFTVEGADTITDFDATTGIQGTVGAATDDNDFVDLSAFYNDTTLAAYNAANPTARYDNPLEWLKADQADGVLQGAAGLRLQSAGAAVSGDLLNIENTGVVCFVRGTRIMTVAGERLIEDLMVGDLVLTMDHGYQPIRWIGSSIVEGKGRFAPIVIEAGVLGNDRSLAVSPQHRMLVSGWQAELYFHEGEVLVAAKMLVNDQTIRVREQAEVEYFHMLFDVHEIVFAEGAPSESFHPGHVGWGALAEAARDEIVTLFPELEGLNFSAYGPTARRSLTAKEARLAWDAIPGADMIHAAE